MHVALVQATEDFILKTATGTKVMSFGTAADAATWMNNRALSAAIAGAVVPKLTLVKITRLEEVIAQE